MSSPRFNRLNLAGLNLAAPQTLGPIRLLPAINPEPREDIRLGLERYDSYGVVNLGGGKNAPKKQYTSFIPHGLIISTAKAGESVAAYGAQLRTKATEPDTLVRVHHRMVKRSSSTEKRILPQHLAMEGFLSLHFGGPPIAWSEYSKNAKKMGLSPRTEFTAGAQRIEGLAEAMRLFEIHEHQVGMLVFIADSLASAFVVSHPEDYRRLHTSLLQDFFAEFFIHYARHAQVGTPGIDLDARGVTDLAGLVAAAEDVHARWHEQAEVMAGGLVGRELSTEVINKMGPFQLERFHTDLADNDEGHIGETIVHQNGSVQYLKTYRLSKNQVKRAHLLQLLAEHDWEIAALAATQGGTPEDIIRRMHNGGFGYLLNAEVLAKAIRKPRR